MQVFFYCFYKKSVLKYQKIFQMFRKVFVYSMIGVIGGTLFCEVDFLKNSVIENVKTSFGETVIQKSDKVIFINRHGADKNTPPHLINHPANMEALKKNGVKYVISACSVGSLHSELKIGSILIPDDYINFFSSTTVNEAKFFTPSFSKYLREILVKYGKNICEDIIDGGVYFQTRGPRFETRAEIRMMAQFADIVGMTMAQEASTAQEFDLEYASICSIDNYANGISNYSISEEDVRKFSKLNADKIRKIVSDVIDSL